MSRLYWIVLFALVSVALNVRPATEDPKSNPVASRTKGAVAPALTDNAKIRSALESNTNVHFVRAPLRKVFQSLQNEHGIAIYLDEGALIEEKIAIDRPVTLSSSGMRLGSLLDRILRPLRLDYVVNDEVLEITSQARAQKVFHLEIHRVRDLLDAGVAVDELREVIKLSVVPQSWDESGVSLQIGRTDLLIVRHHPKAQRELSRTLAKLRAAIAPRSDARVATERKGDASSMDLEAAWRKLTSRRRRKPVSEPPSEEKTRRALRSPVEFDFLDTPLCDGVRYLSDYHDIPIWLDEQGLTDDNIAPDTPVTLRLEGRSLESALELLLTPLQIDYGIDGGSLQITAMAVMNKTFSAEFYSVRELVEGGFTEDELREILTPSLKVRAVTHEGSNPFGGIGRLMDTVPMPDEQPTLRLVAGRILVVRATPRGHRQLLGALEKLRAGARR